MKLFWFIGAKYFGTSDPTELGYRTSSISLLAGNSGFRVPLSGFDVPEGVMTFNCCVTKNGPFPFGFAASEKFRLPAVKFVVESRNTVLSKSRSRYEFCSASSIIDGSAVIKFGSLTGITRKLASWVVNWDHVKLMMPSQTRQSVLWLLLHMLHGLLLPWKNFPAK